jgi:hypothetical protein
MNLTLQSFDNEILFYKMKRVVTGEGCTIFHPTIGTIAHGVFTVGQPPIYIIIP